MKALVGLLFLLQVIMVANAQRVCASEIYSQKLLSSNPSIKAGWNKAEAEIAATLKAASSFVARDTTTNETIYLPVVIHIVYNKTIENITDAQVKLQLVVLNDDYSNSNIDKINTLLAVKKTDVPFPPAMTSPPIFGLTANKIKPVFIISCPTIKLNGMSNFVFDSDVNCNDGDDIAFFTFSGSIPKKLTEGDFSASTDSVPALFNMMTAGEDLGSIAATERKVE